MKASVPIKITFYLLGISGLIGTCCAQITANFWSSGVVTMDVNHVGGGNIYYTPAESRYSSAPNPSISDDHTMIVPDGDPTGLLHGFFSVDLNETVNTDNLSLSGRLNSRCNSVEVTDSRFLGQFSVGATSYHSTSFTLTEAVSYSVSCNATAVGYLASISLYQDFPNESTVFNMGSGVTHGSEILPDAPGTKSGILPAGRYNLLAQASSASKETNSSVAAVGFTFELGSVAPPRLFLLAIGEYDGAGVNGYLDAQDVFDILRKSPNFAPSSLGNPIGVLHLVPNDTGTKNRISQILSGMIVRPQDTVIFYFSGHGGYDSNGYFVDLETEHLYDFELAALFQNNPNLRDAHKIFILDSCHSAGFEGKFESSLSNFGFLAASSADGTTASLNGGRGIYTTFILIPYLYVNQTFQDLENGTAKEGVRVGQNLSGQIVYLKEVPGSTGLFTFSGNAFSSPDFDSSQTIIQDLGSTVPALRIVRNGSNLEVRWSANSTEWTFETNTSLATGSWTPVVGSFSIDAGEYVYSFAPTDSGRIYRLNHASTTVFQRVPPNQAREPVPFM